MNVKGKIFFILFFGCALLAQSALAATIVAASDASASSKATANYVCDGSGDQTELNAALASGGEVVMTEGTFRTSGTVYVKSGNIFRGQGPDKTVLSMAGDYAARVDIAQSGVTVSDFKITNRGWLMITTSNVKVHDVTIQDSKKTAPTVNGMFFVWADGKVCENIEFVRCKAIDVGSTGFNLNGQKSPRVNRNIRFDDCLALRCGNAGSGKIWAVGFDFHEGADLYDLTVNNCRADDCWESGFYFEPNFYNGNDPNTAIPVQVNSRVSNCVAVNNGWRNTEPTRFYMTGYYLSCGVTLTNCVSVNSKNNGFWVWQGAKDVILNGCTDDGSDKSFQVRTGTNLKFNNCVSKNARTHALYMWGSSGVVFGNFKIYNPKKSSGAISLGLREDHPNDPWAVTGCTLDILLSGADPNTLIRYYNAKNNQITINGFTPGTETPTPTITTTPIVEDPVTPTVLPPGVGKSVIPGLIEMEDYDDGGEGIAYHDTTAANEGGMYRNDGVDIEYCSKTGSHVVDYNRPGEWYQYTADVKEAGTYDVTFKVSSPNTGTSFKLSVDGKDAVTVAVPKTGDWNTFTNVKEQVSLTAGKHVLRITTAGFHNLCCMQFALAGTTGPTTIVSSPSPDVPAGAAIPGQIEAENYNTGGEGVAYHDTTPTNEGGVYRQDGVDIEMSSSEGSYVVGWVRPGEWLKYTVNVEKAGIYDVSFRVSSPKSDSSFMMQLDGTDLCKVMVPNTGSYLTYQTVTRQVSLPAGSHVIRLYFNGYSNVNWIKFQASTSTGGTPGATPPTEKPDTPVPPTSVDLGKLLPPPIPMVYGYGIIPGVIQAEDYNTGGEGVGYYDTTASNFGGIYRNDDVDIELSEVDDKPVVCWIRPGEWLKYTANVRQTGDYDVVFRVSSPNANTQMRLQVDGITATTITVPKTGDYEKYTNVTQRIRLNGGAHVLRLVFGGYHNIDYMAFGAAGSLTESRAMVPLAGVNATLAPTIVPPTAMATATATANATTPAPTVTDNATVQALSASSTPTLSATATTTANATTTATANATTAIPTPASTERTVAAPIVPAPAVPTGETTTPAATTVATTATTSAPSPRSTGDGEAPTAVPTPTATATENATATVTVTPTETAVANETPAATPTEVAVPEPLLMQLAATDRNLTTFVSAVETAGLSDTLNGAGPYTIFAPTNEAFEALPPGTLDALLADRTLLASVLGHHVAGDRFAAADIAGMQTIRMLKGEPVTVTVLPDGGLELDGATVNQTDVQAGNGVIHVIDAVILPPSLEVTQTVTVASAVPTVANATPTVTATNAREAVAAAPAVPKPTETATAG